MALGHLWVHQLTTGCRSGDRSGRPRPMYVVRGCQAQWAEARFVQKTGQSRVPFASSTLVWRSNIRDDDYHPSRSVVVGPLYRHPSDRSGAILVSIRSTNRCPNYRHPVQTEAKHDPQAQPDLVSQKFLSLLHRLSGGFRRFRVAQPAPGLCKGARHRGHNPRRCGQDTDFSSSLAGWLEHTRGIGRQYRRPDRT